MIEFRYPAGDGLSKEAAFRSAAVCGGRAVREGVGGMVLNGEIDGSVDIETNERGGRQSKLAERADLLPPSALLAVAKVLKEGAEKYGDRNWRQIECQSHLNHAMRHLLNYLAGDKTESHLEHAACRILMGLEIKTVGLDPSPK